MTDFNESQPKIAYVTQADVDRLLPTIREHLPVEFEDDFGFIAGPHSVDGTYAIGAQNPDNEDEWMIVWEVPEDDPSLARARLIAVLARLLPADKAEWEDLFAGDDDED